MTVLTAAQSAGLKLLGVKPSSLFSTTDQFSMELADLANTVAADMSKEYDWRILQVLATHTGDAATIAFPLPTDYLRMLKDGKVHSSMFKMTSFKAVTDADQWIYLQDTLATGSPGWYFLLGGRMQVYPAMPIGETARYYYISNKLVAVAAGAAGSKATFTADTDVFVLDEGLLTLALIWRWRSMKRMDYSEDMENYEIAKAQAIAADRGSKILVVGAQRGRSSVDIAFPGVLGP
jgi:hypothetical protein